MLRTWNLFHGNTWPPGRRRHLERMIRLVVEDGPAVVFLQELPAASVSDLEGWSGYGAVGEVAMRPRLPARLAKELTDLHPGLIRSAVEGQANAILVAPGLVVRDRRCIVLNPKAFRGRLAAELGLGVLARAAWARERRVCHAVRVALPDGRTLLAANLHATSYRLDKRLADAELLRAAAFADGLAEPGEPTVLAGDFNVTVVSSPVLRSLGQREWGFSEPGPGLDHVLVRGLDLVEPERHWEDRRRRLDGVLLSDHDPVDVVVE